MRRLEDEHGAVAVMVAVLLVVLIAVGAFVVDVGMLYFERRQLQNGADAAALALVQECMDEGLPCSNVKASEGATARTFTDANAIDGVADALVDFDAATCRADVTASTLDGEGGTLVLPALARIFDGYEGMTVQARAVAECGGIGGGAGLPLIFDAKGWHNVEKVQPPENPDPDWWKDWTPEGEATGDLFFQQGTGYGAGAFGWLSLDPGTSCEATVTAGGEVDTDTGNDFSCDFHNGAKKNAEAFEKYILENQPHFVPMYESYSGTGNNLTYKVAGFAVIYITGWHFSGNHYQYNAPCSGKERCLSGHFLAKITLDEFKTGGADFGVYSYGLVE